MSKEKFYQQIELELRSYQDIMEAVLETVFREDVSKYPIIVAHHEDELAMGIPIVQHQETGDDWSLHISTLEEFSTKQLIAPDKIDAFREVYKDPATHICIFYIGQGEQQFLFMRRNP